MLEAMEGAPSGRPSGAPGPRAMASAEIRPRRRAEGRIHRGGLVRNRDGAGSEAGLKVGGAPTVLKCLINLPLGGPAGPDELNDGSELIGASLGEQAHPVKGDMIWRPGRAAMADHLSENRSISGQIER